MHTLIPASIPASPVLPAPPVNFSRMVGDFPIHGFVRPGQEAAAAAFCANFAEDIELGAGFCAIQDGETLIDLCGGFADAKRQIPWAEDHLAPVFSTTKPIATLTALLLIGEGKLDFTRPIAEIWPEFAAHGKGQVTLAQALSHQAGVPGFAGPIDPELWPDLWYDWAGLATRLAAEKPFWEPGSGGESGHGYHPITFGWLLGEPVRRAAGRSLGTLLRERLAGPLGADFHIGLADEDHSRCVEIRRPPRAADFGELNPETRAAFLAPWSAPTRGGADYRRAEIPSANGHGTARGTALLYSLYAGMGEVQGLRLIDSDVVAEALRVEVSGPDRVVPFNVEWAKGILRNNNRFFGPDPSAFGHAGWGGSCGFADPGRRLAGGYVMNLQSPHLMGDPRPMRLIEAVYSAF